MDWTFIDISFALDRMNHPIRKQNLKLNSKI